MPITTIYPGLGLSDRTLQGNAQQRKHKRIVYYFIL
jgi:hypothetical protein